MNIMQNRKRHDKRIETIRLPYVYHVFSKHWHIKQILHQIAG